MKDFVRMYGRIAGVAAGAAFVLSLLVGLASRNPFGVALLRALVLALVFGAFGMGLRYVFTRYLSELPAEAPAPAQAEMTSGRTVDITLPEETPPIAGPGREALSEEATLEEADSAPAPDAPPGGAPAEEPALGDLREPRGGGLERALEDELPPLVEPDAAAAPADSGTEAVEEAESVGEEASEASSPRAGRTPPGSAVDSSLDSLPDISSIGGPSTRRSAGAEARPGRRPTARETPEDAMKGRLAGQDPATLARAIRTVLKRDERG